MKSGIYIIENIIDGKIYIGSAIDIQRRWGEHLRYLRGNYHENKHLQESWNKYGEVSFRWDILLYCENESLIKKEQEFIDFYKGKIGWRMMYNSNPNAGSRLGSKASDETKKKMSINNARPFTGKKHSIETKKKLSEIAKQRWVMGFATGHKLSNETKDKIGKSNTGKRRTEETKQKISIANKGKRVSDSTKIKLKNSTRFSGHHHTEEAKANMSAKLKGKIFSEETKKRISDGVKAWRAKLKNEIKEDK